MSTREDFDDFVTARIRAAAPQEAPPHLMDTIVNRVVATPQRRRGPSAWLGSWAFRLAAVAIGLVIAVVAVTQVPGLLGPPVGTDPSPTIPGPSPSGSGESPSATAAPSEAGSADELVLRLKVAADTFYGPNVMPEFVLLADGTVVWLPVPASDEPSTLVMRRLTADGLAALRAHIFASGLLEDDATFELEPRPDAGEPPGHGVEVYTFTVDDGRDEPVVVTSAQWLGDEEESTYDEPAPEREAHDALARELRDPESVLSADAWAGPAAAYEADDYLLVLRPIPDMPSSGAPDESEIQWPFDGPLEEFGKESGEVFVARCGSITAEEATPIVEAIAASGSPAGMTMVTTTSLGWAEGNGVVDTFLIPRMPDGYAECEDLP